MSYALLVSYFSEQCLWVLSYCCLLFFAHCDTQDVDSKQRLFVIISCESATSTLRAVHRFSCNYFLLRENSGFSCFFFVVYFM